MSTVVELFQSLYRSTFLHFYALSLLSFQFMNNSTSILSFHPSVAPFAVLLLNTPESLHSSFVWSWNQARYRICADGAANLLMKMQANSLDEFAKIPDFICGDLDSVKENVAAYYVAKGTLMISSKCQNTNDYEKCLKLVQFLHELNELNTDCITFFESNGCDLDSVQLKNGTKSKSSASLLVFGSFGGRFDQTMANISASLPFHLELKIVHFGLENAALIIPQSNESILVDVAEFKSFTCGLIPLFGAAVVKTQGFSWNLNGECIEFGKFISSSNSFAKNPVEITSNVPLLLCVSIPEKSKDSFHV